MQPVKHQTAAPKPSVGLAIRDDGMLFPATEAVLQMSNFRPYHGDPYASLDERMAYLRGDEQRSAVSMQIENGTFNIATATKGDLAEFALIEYGATLDLRKSLDALRREVEQLAHGPPADLSVPSLSDMEPELFKRKKQGSVPRLSDVDPEEMNRRLGKVDG